MRRRFFEEELQLHSAFLERTLVADDSIDALLAESDRALSTSALVFGQRPTPEPRPPTPPEPPPTPGHWRTVRRRAELIAEKDCAVCLGALDETRPKLLLSCAHVFHANCVHALEAFNLQDHHLCPCCRSKYHSHPFSENVHSHPHDDDLFQLPFGRSAS